MRILEVKNRCLLSKWLFRLSVETDGVRGYRLLRNKYLQTKTLAQAHSVRPNDSPFWKGVNEDERNRLFQTGVNLSVGNGNHN